MIRMSARASILGGIALAACLSPLQSATPEFDQWTATCAKLPTNIELNGQRADPELLPIRDAATLGKLLDAFIAHHKSGPLGQAESWVGQRPAPSDFFATTPGYFRDPESPFFGFAEKIQLPAGSKAVIQGDLHGDIHSLMESLAHLRRAGVMQGFEIIDPSCHLSYTGDLVDRGAYGTEVVATLLTLKLTNPGQVHIARGNHEDFRLFSRYGFLEELRTKFGPRAPVAKMVRCFDLLPAVIYLGTATDLVQMNHGGMEPGYDPRGLLDSDGRHRYQLLGELKRGEFLHCHPGCLRDHPDHPELIDEHFVNFTPRSVTSPRPIGFLWHDFTVFHDDPDLVPGRPLSFGRQPTATILRAHSTDTVRLRAVVRGHQHSSQLNPLMARLIASDGIFRHWQQNDASKHAGMPVGKLRNHIDTTPARPVPDGSVWTFNVSPDSQYGTGCRYSFAAYGILHLRENFTDWKMQVVPVEVAAASSARRTR